MVLGRTFCEVAHLGSFPTLDFAEWCACIAAHPRKVYMTSSTKRLTTALARPLVRFSSVVTADEEHIGERFSANAVLRGGSGMATSKREQGGKGRVGSARSVKKEAGEAARDSGYLRIEMAPGLSAVTATASP